MKFLLYPGNSILYPGNVHTITVILLIGFGIFISAQSQKIPLPEHPRPDFERPEWENMNGEWDFRFDSLDAGISEHWFDYANAFEDKITVPFPWGSKLSGIEDKADIGWYHKEIAVNSEWSGKRIFLIVGASDWETLVWLDGNFLGKHQGGYVPFSFELTKYMKPGISQHLVIRVDDKRRNFTLYGKQGYGNARGIWQTVYLEARPYNYADAIHFIPDIENSKVVLDIHLTQEPETELPLSVSIKTDENPLIFRDTFPKGDLRHSYEISIPSTRLWTLEDPYLYETSVKLGEDSVNSYFGMRKISVMNLPGTEYPYIALNNKPVYLQLALDQSYHPDGYYTFPSDQFIKEEIERSKSIGLNGIRPHIKVEIPRKLYWADKLGLLVMQDLPNSWGEPGERMKRESEYTLRQMIKRDFNHPSIFSWILFNETWGLRTAIEENGKTVSAYLPETQYWVSSMYYLTKSLDPTRLVEDNSVCCGIGHTETDLVSFHDYLPGWMWEEKLADLTKFNRYYGNPSLFEEGFEYQEQPIFNSECGNVWGYEGSTGDVDWSWDYHRMINTFRKFPKIAGWLYTEHHDVINEWNGYWRFDRSEKFTGLNEIFPGMSLNDLHSTIYLSTGNEISREVKGGSNVSVPLYLSSMTSEDFGDSLNLEYSLEFTNKIGEQTRVFSRQVSLEYEPWIQSMPAPLEFTMPEVNGLAVLKLKLSDPSGTVLHRNFMHFIVNSEVVLSGCTVLNVTPDNISNAEWSQKQWEVMDGAKINGTGSGFFEYTLRLPENFKPDSISHVIFIAEVSAKQLFVKDTLQDTEKDFNFMLGERAEPSRNPNSYPMTDETRFASDIFVSVNGINVFETTLPDDPADHRGVLSWHYQLQDRKLREAGSYGYLLEVPISKEVLDESLLSKRINVRLKTIGNNGIAIYGRRFGRFPVDPSVVIYMN